MTEQLDNDKDSLVFFLRVKKLLLYMSCSVVLVMNVSGHVLQVLHVTATRSTHTRTHRLDYCNTLHAHLLQFYSHERQWESWPLCFLSITYPNVGHFNEKYITVFAAKFSYRYNVLFTELQDLRHATKTGVNLWRPKSRTFTSYDNALWMNGISWISASLTKSLESGKRDFELVWLQEEDSLNIRCEHFSLIV